MIFVDTCHSSVMFLIAWHLEGACAATAVPRHVEYPRYLGLPHPLPGFVSVGKLMQPLYYTHAHLSTRQCCPSQLKPVQDWALAEALMPTNSAPISRGVANTVLAALPRSRHSSMPLCRSTPIQVTASTPRSLVDAHGRASAAGSERWCHEGPLHNVPTCRHDRTGSATQFTGSIVSRVQPTQPSLIGAPRL